MPILKDLVQVLRVHEQSNTSLIVALLGRKLGQFRVLIKGGRRYAKRGFEGGFDLLSRGEILVYPRPGDNLWIFKEWDERARPALGESIETLHAASYFCELTETLTRPTAGAGAAWLEKDADDVSATAGLYDLLEHSTDALASGGAGAPLLLGFTLRALELEGILPPLSECQQCARALLIRGNPPPRIWASGRGLTCLACLNAEHRLRMNLPPNSPPVLNPQPQDRGVWIQPEAYRALLHIHRTFRPVKLSARAAGELARLMILFVHGALERDLRTLIHAAKLVARP